MRWTILPLVLLLLANARAHGAEKDVNDPLEVEGEDLMVGEFRGPQNGTWVVVPGVDAPLPCVAEGVAVPAGDGAVRLLANATHVQAAFPHAEGYQALALDTGHARRTLVMMQEHTASLHDLVATVTRMDQRATRGGVLGLLHPIEGTQMHDMDMASEGGGVMMGHERPATEAEFCLDGELPIVRVARQHGAADPGAPVHAVVLRDPGRDFLPRPIDGSTSIVQLNLLLARPGEDAASMQAALDPAPRAIVVSSLALALLGLAWVGRP